MAENDFPGWHGTTIIGVKKGGEVVVAGDGQVSLGQTGDQGHRAQGAAAQPRRP
jgi:ATP-dependent HslUV protease subunit HslV